MSPEVEALAAKIEAAFAGAGTAAAAGQAALAAAVEAAFPGLRERTGRGGAARASVSNAARLACQRLTRRALDAGEAPMRWAPPGAAAPALPLLLDRLYGLAQASLTDHPPVATVSGLLEEVADASSGEACGDVLDFLAAREATFREVRDNKMPLLRLCNRLLARFSRASEPQLCAAALVFLAKVLPLGERSGLNIQSVLAPPLISAPEAVPPGAVDSSGQPVDALLYAATWGLQPLLANPRETATPDAWAKFVAGVRTVLAALSAQPAQVAAGATGAAGAGGGEGTVGYLSSPQLFGLQLRDATFRRALLVQVLVLLQAVQGPVKAADPTLRAKQQPEAAALEAEVYAALEATPDDGKAFVAALRGVLRREEGWVQWKRGGPPPAPAPKDAKACPDYERPPLEPGLAERVAEGEQKAAAAAARAQARRDAVLAALAREKRSVLEMDLDEMQAPRKRIKTDSEALRGASRLDSWVYRVPDSNMEGLKASERPGFPTLELLARPALEQMDPDNCVEPEYRLAHCDAVYRWRLARLLARKWPGSHNVAPLPPYVPGALKDRLTSGAPGEVEYVLARTLPQEMLPPAWVEAETAKQAKAEEKKKEGEEGGPGASEGGGHAGAPSEAGARGAADDAAAGTGGAAAGANGGAEGDGRGGDGKPEGAGGGGGEDEGEAAGDANGGDGGAAATGGGGGGGEEGEAGGDEEGEAGGGEGDEAAEEGMVE